MKKRMMAREVILLATPVKAHGTDAKMRIAPIGIRAPYLSQTGPLIKRMRIVPATEQMDVVQMSVLVTLKVFLMSTNKGATANQMKKATWKLHQEQWNARMCGREKLRSLISVARSSWFGSTLQA